MAGIRLLALLSATALAGGLSHPTFADCVDSRLLTSLAPNGIDYSYVYSPGLCEGGAPCPSGTSVSTRVAGFFWALGHGDPALDSGIDSGSMPAWDGFPGTGFLYIDSPYPASIYADWSDVRTDGCIDDAIDAGTACAAMAVTDLGDSCTPGADRCVSLAVVTTETQAGGPLYFGQLGGAPIELAPLPGIAAAHEEPVGRTSVSIPAPSNGLYLDPACGDPLAGYRVWVSIRPFGSPPTGVERDNGEWTVAIGGSGANGEPLAFGGISEIRFGCDAYLSAFLAYSIVFESGFELPYLSQFRPTQLSPDGAFYCCPDLDLDGFCTQSALDDVDCDDGNAAIFPWAPQVCGDGLNNDCRHPSWPSLEGTNEFDDDDDGFTECDGDCEDDAASIYPGAGLAEVCDGLDNNCDGRRDEAPGLAQRIEDPTGVAGGHFGVSVARLDDVDGDGVDDLIIGARWDTTDDLSEAGSATVFSGATRSALQKLTHPSPAAGDNFGRSVAGIGDVNGDGIGDIVVGAPLDDVGDEIDAGSAHVFSGDASLGFPALHLLTDLTPAAGAEFGYSIAAIGDVDDDLVSDLVVGAREDGGSGSASIVSGASGDVLRELTDAAGSSGDRFGYAVAGIDDLDGDSVDDVLVGAYLADSPTATEAGKVLVFSGADGTPIDSLSDPLGTTGENFGRSVVAIDDMDGDNLEEILVGAPGESGTGALLIVSSADGTVLHRIYDPDGESGDDFGYRVDRLGDLDGDGHDDFVASSFRDDGARGANTGSVTVISGAARTVIRKLEDPQADPDDLFGIDVAGLGDLDGDGVREVLVGAYLGDAGAGNDSGRAVLFWGATVEDLDGDGLADRCDGDLDGDNVPNEQDCAPRDINLAYPPPEIDGIRFSTAKTELRWDDVPDSTNYDVFRGAIFPAATAAACWYHDRQFPFVITETLAPGEGRYYLVRGRNDCGIGTLGTDSDGLERVPGQECP